MQESEDDDGEDDEDCEICTATARGKDQVKGQSQGLLLQLLSTATTTVTVTMSNTETEELELPLPSPLLLLKSKSNLGNYFVASRLISPGEVIFEEFPISDSAFGFPATRPDCLTCSKDLTYSQKCKICHWPVCNRICSAAPRHLNFECLILAKNKVQYNQKNAVLEYLGIEVLRCLLLRDTHESKWTQIEDLEAHIASRNDQSLILTQISHVVHFIRVRCKLIQFDAQVIAHVLGALGVNAFCGITCIGRCTSLLFAKASLFNHDCCPNTTRHFWEEDLPGADANCHPKLSIQLVAARTIFPGEIISTNYADLEAGIIDRGSFLMEHYYFHCDCCRCRLELFNEIHQEE